MADFDLGAILNSLTPDDIENLKQTAASVLGGMDGGEPPKKEPEIKHNKQEQNQFNFDDLLKNMGGLDAPEDDKESHENLVKGTIAHKVVELLVNKNKTEAYSLAEIQSRFKVQYDDLFKQAMEEEKEYAAFLNLPENVNMLALFKEDAKESIKHLIDIIKEKGLTPLCSEYEFSTPFGPLSNPHGYVDLLLENGYIEV